MISQLAFVVAALPLLVGAAIAAFVAAFAFRRSAIPGATAFAIAMLALCEWSLAYALSISSVGPAAELFWNKMSYVGIASLPVAWYVFAAEYTGARPRFSTSRWALLLILPLVTIVMVATDPWHHLMWEKPVATPGAGYPVEAPVFGAWFWVHTVYCYALLALGGALLLRMALRSRHVYRAQSVIILVGLLLPITANVIFLTGVYPYRGLDLTPFVLAVSSALFAVGLFRLHMLDLFLGLVPVARDAAVESMADGVIVVDSAGRVADVNAAAVTILGASKAVVVGRTADELAIGSASLSELLEGPSGSRVQTAVDSNAGRSYFDLIASPVGRKGDAGRIVVVRDMTGPMKIEEALRASEERYRTLFENAHDLVFTLALDGSVESINQAGLDMLEYSREEMARLRIADLVAPEQAEAALEWLAADHRSRSDMVGSVTLISRSGRRVEVEPSVHSLTRGGEVVALQGIARNVTERKMWEDALRHQALHDTLTNLPNRTLLLERLGQAIALGNRTPATHALLVLDLDRFKEVNDTYGHHIGDEVLREVSARFHLATRASDTVSRLGGDEFAVLMLDVGPAAAASGARRMLATLEEPVVVERVPFRIGASVGIATYPSDGSDAHTLLRQADVAMYAAKRGGEGVSFYSPDEDPNSPSRVTLLAKIDVAVRDRAFTLQYQPIVDLQSGATLSFEALARWRDDELGNVRPDVFIPLLEEMWLIKDFTLWALEEALRKNAEWRANGHDVAVAVNLSARNLHDEQMPEIVERLCLLSGVDPSVLTLEVTEGSIMVDQERALGILRRISALGTRVAVDDFGTGYSSLAYLQRLPASQLKIDRSFVQRIAHDAGNAAIVRSTIDLGHDLGLSVLAEGVENQATWDLLGGLGCDAAQGFLMARPMPADATVDWLRDRKSTWVGAGLSAAR